MISFLPKRAILEKVTRQLRRARAAVESFDKRDRDGGVFLLIHAIIIHHHKLNLDESMLAHMHEHLFAFSPVCRSLFIATSHQRSCSVKRCEQWVRGPRALIGMTGGVSLQGSQNTSQDRAVSTTGKTEGPIQIITFLGVELNSVNCSTACRPSRLRKLESFIDSSLSLYLIRRRQSRA